MEITLKINAENCNKPKLEAWLDDFADICDANFADGTYGYTVETVITDDKVLPKHKQDKQPTKCDYCNDDDYNDKAIETVADKKNHSCHCEDCDYQKKDTNKGTDKLIKIISDIFDFPWGIF